MMWQLREFPELFVDAVMRDEAGGLMFMSVYGRDGALQQMMAAFTLPVGQGGINTLTLVDEVSDITRIAVGSADRLAKHMGRLPATLFGQLTHMWIYDQALTQLDRANRAAWLVWPGADPEPAKVHEEVWATIKQLSPVPLLDSWMQPVLGVIGSEGLAWANRFMHPPLGRISGLHLTLPNDFATRISTLVRTQKVGLDADFTVPGRSDHRRAA